MKKLISLFSVFSLVSFFLPLVSCYNADWKVEECKKRFTMISKLRIVLGLIDQKGCSKLVVDTNDMFDFDSKEYLNKFF